MASKIREDSMGNFPIPSDQPMPDIEILEDMFIETLNEIDLSEEEKAVMMTKPAEYKWLFILSQQEAVMPATPSPRPTRIQSTPQYYVEELRSGVNKKLLKNIRNAMGGDATGWLNQFFDLGGLRLLMEALDNLEKSSEKNKHNNTLIIIILRALGTIMTNEVGMKNVLEKNVIKSVVLHLDSHSSRVRYKTLELLVTVCLYSAAGHRYVTRHVHLQRNI